MQALTPQQQTLWLFAGTAVVLVIASLVGWILKVRVARNQSHSTIDNLNSRIKAWWFMVAIIGLAFSFGKGGVLVLFALASFLALREFLTIAPTRRGDHIAMWVSFFVILPLQYFLIAIEWYGLFSIFIPVYAFLLLPIVAVIAGQVKDFLPRSATVQWGLRSRHTITFTL